MKLKYQIKYNDKIFATGVFLKPEKVIINNIEQWRWIAVGFEDDTFCNGKIINPNEYAENLDNLIVSEN